MATTTYSTAATGVSVVEGMGYNVVCKPVTLSVTANPTAADVVQLLKVPKGAIILDLHVVASDMDTNGTPLMTFSIGYGGSTAYWISTSTVAQAGGVARPTALTARPLTMTDEDTIDLLWVAAAATFAAGTIDLVVTYVNP
jgi:hypothetical protein